MKIYSKKSILTILKVVFTVFPLYYIFSKINIHNLYQTFKEVSWWTIPTFIVITLSIMTIQGLRWWLLMRPFEKNIPLSKSLYCHFAAQYYSVFLPTSAAQDFIRAVLLSKYTDGFIPWAATFISRLTGLLLLFFYSLLGIVIIGKDTLPYSILNIILISFVIFIAICILSFSKKFTRPIRNTVEKILPQKISYKISEIRQAIYCYRDRKKVLVYNLFVTAVVQLLAILSSIVLIKGISGTLFFFESLAFIPVIEVITMSLPVTPSGIGIRDGLVAIYFNYLHLSNEQLGAYILLSYIGVTLKLVGVFPVIFGAIPKNLLPKRNIKKSEL